MKFSKENLLLYAVTDRSWLGEHTLYEQVEEALKGGATFLQPREKELDTDAFLAEAIELQQLCGKYHIPLVINDNVDIARQINADGVHVGQHDMEVGKVRAQIGADKILGVSVQTAAQAILAQQRGADYLGVGAIFHTGSKADADAVGLETLKAICDAISIPVVAIGGIGTQNVLKLAGSGICGIAVISAIFAAKDIRKAASELKTLTEQVVSG